MSFTLILDTSTERAFVAIAEQSRVVWSQLLPFGMQSSKWLMGFILEGCAITGIAKSQIKEIAVGIGPGLFTGIRVGVSVAKGMAFALSIPLKGFSSLHGFVSPHAGEFYSVIDLRMGGVAYLKQKREGEKVRALDELQNSSLEEFNLLRRDASLVGPALHRLSMQPSLEIDPNVPHIASLVTEIPPSDPKLPFPLIYFRSPL